MRRKDRATRFGQDAFALATGTPWEGSFEYQPRRLHRGDIDFLHAHHRVERALGFIAAEGSNVGRFWIGNNLSGSNPLREISDISQRNRSLPATFVHIIDLLCGVVRITPADVEAPKPLR
jgi:hypothetical protein